VKMTDTQLKDVGAALYVVLGAHDASVEALDLALAIAEDSAMPLTESVIPYVAHYPTRVAFDSLDAMQDYLRAAAKDLIARAHACGAKIEISLDSPAPYAMGNHTERIAMRAIPDNSIEDPRSRRAF
jgi:hypothetical protein